MDRYVLKSNICTAIKTVSFVEVQNKELSYDTKLGEDLGMDQIDVLEMIIQLEIVFGIEINDEVSDQWTENPPTIKEITDYIDNNFNQDGQL